MTEAKSIQRKMAKETGDIYCIREWLGTWIVYPLGFNPEPSPDDEDDEE